jgi:mRNA-degrading endonuclease RelE of RelBE toxin-antitoxin system
MRQGRWGVELLPGASRELQALRPRIQKRLRVALRSLAEDPMPADSIPMRGKDTGLSRLRVGNYRIVYRIQRSIVAGKIDKTTCAVSTSQMT